MSNDKAADLYRLHQAEELINLFKTQQWENTLSAGERRAFSSFSRHGGGTREQLTAITSAFLRLYDEFFEAGKDGAYMEVTIELGPFPRLFVLRRHDGFFGWGAVEEQIEEQTQ